MIMAAPPRKDWQAVPTYPRTTRAPTRQYPSVSLASKASYGPIFNMIAHEPTDIPSQYNLGNLLGCSTEGWKSTDAEDAVKGYVQRTLSDSVSVSSREKLVLRPKVDTLAVSPTAVPDGSAPTSEDASTTEFIYEVDSDKNWEAMRDKLLVQLARMLASLRNCYHPNDEANKVIGFYFPFENTECVVEVTVQWSDEMVKFVEKCRYLEQHEVESALRNAYQHNHQLWARKDPEPSRTLNYPLSTRFLQSRNLEQIESGQSIVLLDQLNKRVYKYPVDRTEQATLYKLYIMRPLGEVTESTRIAFPHSLEDMGTFVDYFVYKMYQPPLSKEDAQNHIVWFVEEAVAAVEELHAQNIAHLDIRLENFCIDCDNNRVMLSDLD